MIVNIQNQIQQQTIDIVGLEKIFNNPKIKIKQIFSYIIVLDSIPSNYVCGFFASYRQILSNKEISDNEKINIILQMIYKENIYIDSVFEIFLDIIYVAITSLKQINKIINLLNKIDELFYFLISQKNEVGRKIDQSQRIYKTIIALGNLTAPSILDDQEDLEVKMNIFHKVKNFFEVHEPRAKFCYEEILNFDNEKNKYFLVDNAYEIALKQNVISQVNITLFLNKIEDLVNQDFFFIKNKTLTALILAMILPYEMSVPALLGVNDYFCINLNNDSCTREFDALRKSYREDFKNTLINLKFTNQISTNLGKNAKKFFNNVKQEIDIANDQLNATANLIRSNLQE